MQSDLANGSAALDTTKLHLPDSSWRNYTSVYDVQTQAQTLAENITQSVITWRTLIKTQYYTRHLGASLL